MTRIPVLLKNGLPLIRSETRGTGGDQIELKLNQVPGSSSSAIFTQGQGHLLYTVRLNFIRMRKNVMFTAGPLTFTGND